MNYYEKQVSKLLRVKKIIIWGFFIIVVSSVAYSIYYDLSFHSYKIFQYTKEMWNSENSIYISKFFTIPVAMIELMVFALIAPVMLINHHYPLSPLLSDIVFTISIFGYILIGKIQEYVDSALESLYREDIKIKIKKEKSKPDTNLFVNNYASSISGSNIENSNIQSNNSNDPIYSSKEDDTSILKFDMNLLIKEIEEIKKLIGLSIASETELDTKIKVLKEEIVKNEPCGTTVRILLTDLKDILKGTLSNVLGQTSVTKPRLEAVIEYLSTLLG